ncbi:MAG: hypothetical protein DRM97_06055 [Thermoprotei archaeon]|nr:MAG: hypothetical protein DRM97_06055 [Thermoprotei archaeon]
MLRIPLGFKVINVKTTFKLERLKGKYRLLPTPQPQPLSKRPMRASDVYKENKAIYSSSRPYPENIVTYEVRKGIDPLTLERVQYVILRAFPVQYLPKDRVVRFASYVEVTVEYEEASPPQEAYQTPQQSPLQTIDMVIITSQALETAATSLAQWKNSTGVSSKVYTVEWITANFEGEDVPAKIRNFINHTVNSYGVKWVILFGDVEHVPTRWTYLVNPYTGYVYQVETDLYYADLDGTWDTDGDGNYGELEDSIDGIPDVIVGRLPVSNITEANNVLDKLKNYNPSNSWFRKVLLLGTITFWDPLYPEGEIVKDYIEYNILPTTFSWAKLYEGIGNLTVENFVAEMNKGYGFVNFAGHGNVDIWSFGDLGSFLMDDIRLLSNGYNTSVVMTLSCLTADFGNTDLCMGEAFLVYANGGAIAYFGASEVAYGYVGIYVTEGLAGEMDILFMSNFIEAESNGTTPTPGIMHTSAIIDYIIRHGRLDFYDWFTVVEYGSLLGDPSLALVGTGSPPTPPPTPRLYGYVVDMDGNIVANATIRLYDYRTKALVAEITTTNGYYEIVGLPPGTYNMTTEAFGYFNTSRAFYYPHVTLCVNGTVASEPKPNTILIVADDDGHRKVYEGTWPDEIASVASAMGFNTVVWSEAKHGRPPFGYITHENIVLVIWHVGTYYDENYVVDSVDAQNLIKFVERGGRLLLEGQDIGWVHGSDDFMYKVAHAIFKVDDAGVQISITNEHHPISYGLPKTFSFDPTVTPVSDGVEPVNYGVEIAKYSETDYSAIVVYDGPYWGAQGKVVYLPFTLHYLPSDVRDSLLSNCIRWLTTTYVLRAETDSSAYAPGDKVVIVAHVLNGSEPLLGISVNASIYYPDGTLAAIIPLHDDGTGGDVVANDGNYTAVYLLSEEVPTGRYLVEVVADIPGYVPHYDAITFDVLSGVPYFNITVKSLTIVEGVMNMVLVVSNNASLNIVMVQYEIDSGGLQDIVAPNDGAYDSPQEEVTIIINATSYGVGEHIIHVKVWAELEYTSDWTCKFMVRELKARYNLIALYLRPPHTLKASDLANAVGPNLLAIWRWDVEKQDFVSYIPGVSPPEEDFILEVGYGYFVYLKAPALLVEVGW